MLDIEIHKYIDKLTSSETELLYNLNRETNLKTTLPRMISGKVQGKFLEMVSLMIKPKRILEIGTFTGYSAICLAKGLREGGSLYTIESNIEMEDIIKKYFDESEKKDQLELIVGDAIQIIPDLDENFDLVFIDADKEEYLKYYKLIKSKIVKGGFILVDNVLWSGKVLNNKTPDRETKALQEFNEYVAQDDEVEQVMLSIRDGLFLIRKL